MSLSNDHMLAAELAREAGRVLLELRQSGSHAGRELRDEGDRRANQFLVESLTRERPGDAVLSEESPDESDRLRSDRVWIIDPLDGTREYGDSDREDWAVHVALAVGGRPIVGAVALPAQGEVLSTWSPPAAPRYSRDEKVIVVSRSRPPTAVDQLADRLGGSLVAMGSAGAKTMAVVRGEADAYVHAGGQFEWDSCAPVAVAQSAGLHTSRLDGSELRYNQADPYLPDLVVCRDSVAGDMLAAIRELGVGQ